MTTPIPDNYFDLMCFLAGVTREDLEAADALVRGMPAPYDNLRVMLEPSIWLDGHPGPVGVGSPPRRMDGFVSVRVCQAVPPRPRRGTDQDVRELVTKASRWEVPAGARADLRAAILHYADRLEVALRYVAERPSRDLRGISELVAAAGSTVSRLRKNARQGEV